MDGCVEGYGRQLDRSIDTVDGWMDGWIDTVDGWMETVDYRFR